MLIKIAFFARGLVKFSASRNERARENNKFMSYETDANGAHHLYYINPQLDALTETYQRVRYLL